MFPSASFSREESIPVQTLLSSRRANVVQSRRSPSDTAATTRPIGTSLSSPRMAKQVGADHHERLLSMQDLIAFLPRMVHLQDEPIADPVCFPVHYVSALAREHGVIVCQVGEGADELFCGYPSWKRMLDLQRLDDLPVPTAAKRLASLTLRIAGRADRREYEFLRRGIADLPVFWSGADALTEAQKGRLLSLRVRRSLAGLTSYDVIQPIRERFDDKAWERSTSTG